MTAPRGDAPRSDFEILTECSAQLRQRLPPGWTLSAKDEVARSSAYDATITISAADDQARFITEIKRSVTRASVAEIASRLREAAARESAPVTPLLMARYLPASAREALDALNLSFIDTTGNMQLISSRPPMVVRDRGAEKDPWRGPGRPRATLEGEPAARVVRALVGHRRTWTARELVTASGASTGATYRVLQFLQEDGLAEKRDAEYVVTDWVGLLRRWSRDYGFFGTNRTLSYIEPRGIETFLNRLARPGQPTYAVTGSAAASQWAPYAPTRAVMVYADRDVDLTAPWGLKRADAGANVFVARAEYDVVFTDRSVADAGYVIVAPEQAAVDLLTGPGRNPAEGEELLTWMTLNEKAWRRD